jgi:hypothetical protein
MDLILTIFLLVLLAESITWIGKAVLFELVGDVFGVKNWIFPSKIVQKQKELRTQILSDKAELLATSSQDQFAKWAKLRRKVDKGLADLEKINAEIAASRSSYNWAFNIVIFIMTTGAQFAIGWWYGKKAVFYLPPGWMGPATWWLSLPFAPRGSVSCGIWQMACRRFIRILERIARDLLLSQSSGSVPASPQQSGDSTKESGPKEKVKTT